MSQSISAQQFGGGSITASKQATPESTKMDGPAPLDPTSSDNNFAANKGIPLPKPGFSN